jgi:hypothetical protein
MHIFEVTKVVVVVVGSWPPKIFSVCHCSNANRCLSKNQINCWSQVGRKIWFFCEFFHLLKRDKLENAVCAVLFVVRKLLGEGSRSRTDEKWLVFTSNVPNRGSNPPKKTFPRSLKTNRVFIYHLASSAEYWQRVIVTWHFKTDHTETEAFCLGYAPNHCLQANWYCVNWLDEEGIKPINEFQDTTNYA